MFNFRSTNIFEKCLHRRVYHVCRGASKTKGSEYDKREKRRNDAQCVRTIEKDGQFDWQWVFYRCAERVSEDRLKRMDSEGIAT